MGRPPVFETAEQMQEKADAYFDLCKAEQRQPTVNGLALALGFNSRQSLLNYAEKPEFLDAVKAIRTRLEDAWEGKLGGPNAAGTIFWLKNQGWTDRSEQLVEAKVEHAGSVTLDPSEAYLRMLNG